METKNCDTKKEFNFGKKYSWGGISWKTRIQLFLEYTSPKKLLKTTRVAFKTLLNICDGAILENYLTVFSRWLFFENSSIIN